MTSGVYRIRHKRSGSAYVGGSINVEKRWSWHLCMLRRGTHTCVKLQEAWDKYGEKSFVLEILARVRGKRLRAMEDQHAHQEKRLLNTRTFRGFTIDAITRNRMREGRARYLEDNLDARRLLSERAKAQHAQGKLGVKTWKVGPRYNPQSGIAGARALRNHIAQQSSAEMSRRSLMRKCCQRGVYR